MAASFTDENLEAVEFKSSWKKERSLKDTGMVTDDLVVKDRGVQSVKQASHMVQTDEEIQEDIQLYEDDSPELSAFLLKMEPLVLKELQKNRRSHAFDGYNVSWEEETESVTCVHTLSHAEIADQLQVTGVSWNCTGSVIAVSYGRFDHEDWCTHKSVLCTWNLDRRKIDATKADIAIDLPSCLMCVACHPSQPSWIAGGSFSGEVLVWDVSRDDDLLVASSGVGNDSHREPVSKLQWVVDSESKGKKYNLVSVATDGRILVWQFSQHQKALRLVDGFALLTESLPRQLRAKVGANRHMGVTCISFSSEDETAFLIGCESGGLFRCSTQNHGTPAGSDVECSIPLHSPVNFSFGPHDSTVHSVECSPYHRSLFLTCGSDCTARIYSMLQMQPVVTLEPNAGYLHAASWSPVRPVVIAMATGSGQLYIYDLKQKDRKSVV